MLDIIKNIEVDKKCAVVKSFTIYFHIILVILLTCTTTVKCEAIGGTGGGGYYIKLFDFRKVCPLHSFCVPWNFMFSSST